MTDYDENTWFPKPHHLENAHVTKLAAVLGLSDYDSLHVFSLEHPDRYWEELNRFMDIRWSKPPQGYADLSRGEEFPHWFPGGELNWVDTVLKWADDPEIAPRRGIVAERESGVSATVSHAELATLIRRVAAGLRTQGLVRGDRVGILCEMGIEATVSLLALSYIGCIAVPLFSGFGTEAIVARLEPARAKALIATTGFSRRGRPIDVVPTVREVVDRLPSIELLVWKGERGAPPPEGGVNWTELAAAEPSAESPERMGPNDPFMVIYTSGTTGKPKGIVHVHGGFPLKLAHDAMVHWDIGSGDVFFWPVDMGWIAGPITVCASLMRGATLVCYDGTPDFPDWSRMSRIVERHGVTHCGAAPTLIRGLAANEAEALQGDRSSVRLLITAGEGIDPGHFNWFRKNFAMPDSPLMNSSGGTEASGVLLCSVQVKPIRPGAFNTGTPGTDVAVVDASGNEIIDEVGELVIRAPFVGMTHSFWEDDARYLETYWEAIDGMWVHGDLALKMQDGSYFIHGRSDDTLKVAGKRMGPAEIERAVLEVAAIQEAAAIGVADAEKGEKLVVFVVLAPSAAADPHAISRQIVQNIDERLGKPFRPSEIYFAKQLPKTRSSKIMRRIIKKICMNQPLGDTSSLSNPEAIDDVGVAMGRS